MPKPEPCLFAIACLVAACGGGDREEHAWSGSAASAPADGDTSGGAADEGGGDPDTTSAPGGGDESTADAESGGGPSEGSSSGGAPDVGECAGWVDPFPALPAANDAAFPTGTSWQVGPNGVEYQISIPEGDTSELPLVLTADVYNGGLRFENVIWLYFPVEAGGHNSWIDDQFWNCWPGCSVFTFLGTDGTETLLLELGGKLRFAHDRVFMDGVGEGREEVTIGLDPQLAPYFAGVVHYYSEWQMAVCPSVAGFTPDPCGPRVMFGMSGCDHSYCPSQSCFETVGAAGFPVTQHIGSDVTGCPCPLQDLHDVPHLLPMPDWVRDEHVQFVLQTTK